MVGAHRLGGPGYHLVERAKATIVRHRMLEGEGVVLAALSGGPDSTALVDVLARLSDALNFSVHVAHVDHGLAEASSGIASRVATASAKAGFEVHVVRAPDLAGPNLQARAREFRYGFFDIVAEQVGAIAIATGHTLDDRAETTLARLVHGAGTKGLAGIPPKEGSRIRPLIEVRRAETRSYCEELALEFIDDPANDDPHFERAAVRNQILEAVTARFGDGAVPAMARSAQRLLEDAAALEDIAERLWPGIADPGEIEGPGGVVRLKKEDLIKLPVALRRRMLERAVGRVRDRAGGIEAVLLAIEGEVKPGARFATAEDVEITVTTDHIVVEHRRPT